jgi:L-2-hydroxyglutarate oxidase LhgO
MDKIDVVIAGGGVIGLAIAEALRRQYPDKAIILMEKHEKFGQEVSGRNSEVIHGGMYYPTGSLKAQLCVKGNSMLYAYCAKHHVSQQKLGKIIITRNKEEETAVKGIYEQGKRNGVPGLKYLTQEEVNTMEPNVFATGALFSATTGIISAHELMQSLEREAIKNGVMIAYAHKIQQVEKSEGGYIIHYANPTSEDVLECSVLFNCLGLYSDIIPQQLGIDIDKEGYRIYPVKGEYFSLRPGKSRLMNHLVYPPPLHNLKGLGIHITKSLDGLCKLGPNAFYVNSKEDYSVDHDHLEEFYQAAHSYLPFVEKDDLNDDMAGIRPKIQAPGAPWQDFIIRNEENRGLTNLINLVGIESPGLTSSLAIAEYAIKAMSRSH